MRLAVCLALVGCTAERSIPVAHQLGTGDATLTLIHEPEEILDATDVAFDPATSALWIVHRRHPPYAECMSTNPTDECQLVAGSVAIMAHGAQPLSTFARVMDSNAWHFMRLPPAIAFGAPGTFATCGDARTGNFDDDPYDFIGPTLFSTDRALFGVEPADPEQNGSHLDMLHASPLCLGIAHERDNVYWVHNGKDGSLDRYDFHRDHGPGADDHSDGEIWHYAQGHLERVAGIPSHLTFHDGQLYAADTGGGRILRLDPQGAQVTGDYEPNYDALRTHKVMSATLVEVVPPGILQRPSGLDIKDGVLFVSDNATSVLYAFDLAGNLLRFLDTGLPQGTITGLTIGPDDKLYFADHQTGRVYRVEP